MKNTDRDLILNNTNYIKTILMILVVVGHSCAMWGKQTWFIEPKSESLLLYFVHLLVGSIHIYSFVMVSGYIFSYIKFEKNGYSNFFDFIKNKVKRLIVPYFVVMISWVIPIYYCFFRFDIKEFLINFVLGVKPAQLWFLIMLFGIFILGYFILGKVYNNFFKGLFISISLFILGFTLSKFIPNIFQLCSIAKFFLFFYLGAQLRHYENKVNKIVNKKTLLLLLLLIVLLLGIYSFFDLQQIKLIYIKIVVNIIGIIISIFGSFITIIVLNMIAQRTYFTGSKIYYLLNKYNFSIYLFHQQLIYFVLYLLNGKIPNVLLALISFLFSIVISLFISLILSKFKTLSKLFGIK